MQVRRYESHCKYLHIFTYHICKNLLLNTTPQLRLFVKESVGTMAESKLTTPNLIRITTAIGKITLCFGQALPLVLGLAAA